ncbi:cytochrome P450 4d8-like [Musca vetustissima]|uniref:cytochrome P450 4d8-like n=1 Tax=Musca vetustissima TaxID=27455 RepID=UPI002AB79B0C|nr:cytochrome P450 4d8-like [Musca vetustissima]
MECVIKESMRLYPPIPIIAREIKEDFKYYQLAPNCAGPRNCIDQKFAIYEMKVVLVTILRAYELLPFGQPIDPVLGIVLRSSTGMQLGLKKRNHASTKRKREAVKNLNGPPTVPILGSVLLAYQINPENFFDKSYEFGTKYGLVHKMWAMNRLVVASADAEVNEQVLTSLTHISKHRLYGVLHGWLGNGLLTSDGRKWHTRRRIITPTFHFKILEEFLEIFDQQSDVLVKCLSEKADGCTAFDVYPFVCAATLDIIAETAMGTKVMAQTGGTKQYTRAVEEMTRMMAWRFLRFHLHNDIVFSIFHPFKKLQMMKNLRIMHEFTDKVIKERRDTLEASMKSASKKSTDDQENHDIGTKKRMALLDVLLQSSIEGEPLSNEDIREEVDTFMFEGHDTTATALSCTLYLLARHPEVQEKLLDEIHNVFGKDNLKPFSLMSLNELKYMECVIKESLRLFPPVPIIAREIKEDFRYKHSKLGEGVIPAGTELVIGIYKMSRDAFTFENPTQFTPERHMKPLGKSFDYLPFSAGPRNCIGQKFAMYEMKVTLAHIIREYELLPLGEDIKVFLGIVLRSKTGMQLGLRRRTK